MDASAIDLSDMGTMGGFGGKNQRPDSSTRENSRVSEGTEMLAQFTSQQPKAGSSAGRDQQFADFGSQGGMTLPEGMENMFSGQNGGEQGGIPDRSQNGGMLLQGGKQWGSLLISAVVLLAGLLFAFKFKR